QLAPVSHHMRAVDAFDLAAVRAAIREQRKMRIAYADENGRTSERTIWPFMIGYFETVRLVVAWCELREDFRHFRSDRFHHAEVPDTRHRCRPHQRPKRWEKAGSARGRRDDERPCSLSKSNPCAPPRRWIAAHVPKAAGFMATRLQCTVSG